MLRISRQPKFTDIQVQRPAATGKGDSLEMRVALRKVLKRHWTSPPYFRKDRFCDQRMKIETIENSEITSFMSARPPNPIIADSSGRFPWSLILESF
jgi:hypothetical protein